MTTRRNFLGSVLALFAASVASLKRAEPRNITTDTPLRLKRSGSTQWRQLNARPATLNDVAAHSGGDVQEAKATMLREQNKVL